jgi:hypothetical protein
MGHGYNGVILSKDSVLSVYDTKTKNNIGIPINVFNSRNKFGRYRSNYRGEHNTFRVNAMSPSDQLYKIVLDNDMSLICANCSKNMVYRQEGNELLQIELLYKKILDSKFEQIYLPYINKDESYNGVDLKYSLIVDIILISNFSNKVYQILFDKDASSVLMKLDNGLVIKGDK